MNPGAGQPVAGPVAVDTAGLGTARPQPSLVSVATWTHAAQQGRWEARMRMHLPPGSTAGLALAPPAATPADATTAAPQPLPPPGWRQVSLGSARWS